MIRSALSVALVLLAAVPRHALAIDYSKVDPPIPVTDRQVGIANRIVKLPVGTWIYIARATSHAKLTESVGPAIATHWGYFADVRDGVFRVGIAMELPEQTLQVRSWQDEPCKDEGKVFKSTLDGSVLLPECLLVNRRDGHLKGSRNTFYASAASWLEANNVSFGGPVYDIFYSRYSGTGHGRIRVFVPVGAFPDERAAIEWAKGIPPRFKEFIEWSESTASLPALPPSSDFDNRQALQKSSSPTVSTASLPALPPSTDFDSKQPLQKSSSLTFTRSLAVSWEGYSRLIPGTVEIQDEGKRGRVLAPLPNSEGECTGVYEMIDRRNGQWALACTNGLSATGKLEAFGQGKGSSGIGVDTKGRRVEFSVGGS